ncbi:acetyl xylan esterase [Enterobacter hormaechei]|nr:acetyl xylan esterase [Enterobacter hormaechei]
MQVHQESRAAPALALAGKISIKEGMQIHAPNACQAINP